MKRMPIAGMLASACRARPNGRSQLRFRAVARCDATHGASAQAMRHPPTWAAAAALRSAPLRTATVSGAAARCSAISGSGPRVPSARTRDLCATLTANIPNRGSALTRCCAAEASPRPRVSFRTPGAISTLRTAATSSQGSARAPWIEAHPFARQSAGESPDKARRLLEGAPADARLVLADRLVDQISQLVSAAGVGAVVRTPEPGLPPRTLASCVLLENIQDPGNLGSILRSAVAAGIAQVFLSRGSVFAWSPKVLRAGMGAHFFLSIFEAVDLAEVARGFPGRIVAMEPCAPPSLFDLDLKGPVAWIFGNEGAGLSESVLRLATHRARIPMSGSAESLNVAAAAAICLFEQQRQRARS